MRKRGQPSERFIPRLLDLLYPPICEICQSSLIGGVSVCPDCLDQLPLVTSPFCGKCGEVFDGNLTEDFRCQNCLGLTFDFDFARASLRGLSQSFHLVHCLKYQRQFYLAPTLASLLQQTLEDDPRFGNYDHPILIPVPLYWRRQQWRQGNQAHELSRALAKLSGHPSLNALKRVRSTSTQTRLNRKQRLSNLRGAFQLRRKYREKLEGRDVILIDDVFTTGATAHECARVLKREGPVGKVAILTLVRG